MKYFIPLEPNKFYHVFNHAVGSDNFFKNEENYIYFLKKFTEYINPIAKTYAYVLMPNHFHFLIELKNDTDIYFRYLELKNGKEEIIEKQKFGFEKFIIQQFSNFFNCYSKSFNKMYSRKGALFIDKLRRVEITDKKYFLNCVQYIHQNPIHHNFCSDIEEWKYSSYKSVLLNKKTHIQKELLLDWFGDLENFIYMHKTLKDIES